MSLKRGMLALLGGSLEIQRSVTKTSLDKYESILLVPYLFPKETPYFKLCGKVIIFKTASHWGKRKHIHQWKKIKGLKTNPYSYRELILTLFLRTDTSERTDFSINSIGETGYPHIRKIMKFIPSFIYTKISSKGIENISIDLVIVLIISFLMGNDIEYFYVLIVHLYIFFRETPL